MIFNSVEFAIFLPVVFLLYWFVTRRNMRAQNMLLLAASYFFYGWWDWRFLALIIFSSTVDFVVGLQLAKTEKPGKRKILLLTSIVVNIGFLGFFKYFNFFAQSFADAFTLLGAHMEPTRLNVILPVGISFYTFQTLSYSIDIYRKKFEPTRDVLAFFAFVSFFPQLVAGPIERARNLLPQFYHPRKADTAKAVDGLRQVLWGLFKKIVIADNCAVYVNEIFGNSDSLSGSTLVLGAVFFAFQIYGDFSGYSDIAIGTARLFGFDLMRNFAYPYFSRDIAEFWRRWHISLSSWFRDYVYIPLGGSRGSTWIRIRNTFIIFIVSGFWHGANWTFIVWGALNALYFLPLLLLNRNRQHLEIVAAGRRFPSARELLGMGVTFGLTVFAWIFFRAEDLSHAFAYIGGIFSPSFFSVPWFEGRDKAAVTLVMILLLMIVEWLGREEPYAIARVGRGWNKSLRWTFYYALVIVIFYFSGEQQVFIYFQF
jgi:alginate O-acetyltransferase complex protein AlgI